MGSKPPLFKTLFAAAIGNALEWYDFGLYGFFALLLQQLFFPFDSAGAGLLSVFLVFAVGFFMRPLGGILFGTIGDRYGRKIALRISLILMGIVTFLFAFLPTYAQAGIGAVIAFVIMRLLQGLAVGGEMMGALTFLSEHAPTKRRGLHTSWIYSIGTVGGLLGTVVGTLLHRFFSTDTLLAWAWRLPFIFGIFVGGVALYIRWKLQETPQFSKLFLAHQTAKSPLKEALQHQKKEITILFFLTSFQAMGYYIPFVYLITWLSQEAHFSPYEAFLLNTWGLGTLILLIPCFAFLSDLWGRRKIMMVGALFTALTAYPLFTFLASIQNPASSGLLVYWVFLGFSIGAALYQGPLASLLTELPKTRYRYTSLAVGYNTSAALFGGTAPFLATYLIQTTHITTSPAFLLIFTSLLSLGVLVFFVRETAHTPLP